MNSNKKTSVVDQDLALSLFLESLLAEPETKPATQAEVDTEIAVPEPEVRTVTPEPTPVQITQIPEPIEEQPEQVELPVAAETTEAPRADQIEPLPEHYMVPEWASEAFQALLFKAGGLTLAVPLVELSGVLEWPDTITAMPGHADFYLGLVNHLDRNVPVVDTARLVLPDERLERLAGQDPLERVSRIVLIDEGRWGLACDSVAEVITLQPGDVRWRESRPNRPWISGTVIEHMCAMVDGQAFAQRLETGDPH